MTLTLISWSVIKELHTFTANSISEGRFWLADAFGSGGSTVTTRK